MTPLVAYPYGTEYYMTDTKYKSYMRNLEIVDFSDKQKTSSCTLMYQCTQRPYVKNRTVDMRHVYMCFGD